MNEEFVEKDGIKESKSEFDLVQIIKTLWDKKYFIYKTIAIFFIIGILIAFLSPKKFTSTATLLPEFEATESSLGRFSSVLQFAGINLDKQQTLNTIPPELYPQIISSIPFKKDLLNSYINTSSNDSSLLFDILAYEADNNILGKIKKYTLGLPGVIKELLTTENRHNQKGQENLPLRLTKFQEKIYESLGERISIKLDEETGIIQISVTLGNDIASAVATQRATALLQKYVIEYKINKTKTNLEFVNARYNEIKDEFNSLRNKLANFKDQNRNIKTEQVRMEERRLEDEYELLNSVYESLAQKKEEAELKVKENTPIFTVIESARIPIKKSSPNRKLILVLFIFLGFFVGLSIIIIKAYTSHILRLINK